MTLLKTLATAVTLLSIASGQALAAEKVSIQGAGYGGNGCPAGSANVTVSPDGQELTILFDQFTARNNRASCNLSIPIKVPQGFQISLYDADYRGYVGPGTTASLRSEYFFAGRRGPLFQRTFYGETNYSVRDSLQTMADVWSRCGDSINMRVNSSMTARGSGNATVDSFDLAHRGMVYYIKYRACS